MLFLFPLSFALIVAVKKLYKWYVCFVILFENSEEIIPSHHVRGIFCQSHKKAAFYKNSFKIIVILQWLVRLCTPRVAFISLNMTTYAP